MKVHIVKVHDLTHPIRYALLIITQLLTFSIIIIIIIVNVNWSHL